MKLLNITYFSIIKNLRNVNTLILVLSSPLFILILGSSLANEFEPTNLRTENIAYINEDRGMIADQFESFILSNETSELLNITTVSDYDSGLNMLNDGSAQSFIHIPPTFSEAIASGSGGKINLVSNREHTIVKSIVDNYLHQANTTYALTLIAGERSTLQNAGGYIQQVPITTDGRIPRAIDYYSVQSLLMFLLYGAILGITAIKEDKEKNTIMRIKSSPVNTSTLLLGRSLANILTLFCATLVITAICKFLFQANWGGSLYINLITVFLFILFTNGLGMLIGIIFKNTVTAIAVLMGLLMFFSTVAGAITPYVTNAPVVRFLGQFSPNHYAVTAIFNNIYAGSGELIISSLAVLLAMVIAIYLCTIIAGRRHFA